MTPRIEARKRSPQHPSRWIYLVAAPVVLIMLRALVSDPREIGEASNAADMPLVAFVVIGLVMSGLLACIWALSVFAHRTPVLLLQLLIVWVGGALYVAGVRREITLWDVAEDGSLLLTTLLQLLPGSHRRTQGTSQVETWGGRPTTTTDTDPTDALMRRGLLVFIVGGFLAFQVPKAIARLLEGGPANQAGAILSLAFSAWLTWRLVLLFRDREVAAAPRYWMVGAVGYGVFAALFIAFDIWGWVAGAYEAKDLGRASVAVLVPLGLAVLSLLAAHRARAREMTTVGS